MLGLCVDSSAADNMPSNGATAVQNLTSYRCVGNVCELQSVIEGAVALAKGSVAEIDAEAEQATTEQMARYAGERGAKLHSSRLNETRLVIHGSKATRRFSAHPSRFVRAWKS